MFDIFDDLLHRYNFDIVFLAPGRLVLSVQTDEYPNLISFSVNQGQDPVFTLTFEGGYTVTYLEQPTHSPRATYLDLLPWAQEIHRAASLFLLGEGYSFYHPYRLDSFELTHSNIIPSAWVPDYSTPVGTLWDLTTSCGDRFKVTLDVVDALFPNRELLAEDHYKHQASGACLVTGASVSLSECQVSRLYLASSKPW